MVRWDVICFVGAKSIYDSSCKGFWGGECPLCLESLRDSTAGHGCLALSEKEITSPWLHGSRGKRVSKKPRSTQPREEFTLCPVRSAAVSEMSAVDVRDHLRSLPSRGLKSQKPKPQEVSEA